MILDDLSINQDDYFSNPSSPGMSCLRKLWGKLLVIFNLQNWFGQTLLGIVSPTNWVPGKVVSISWWRAASLHGVLFREVLRRWCFNYSACQTPPSPPAAKMGLTIPGKLLLQIEWTIGLKARLSWSQNLSNLFILSYEVPSLRLLSPIWLKKGLVFLWNNIAWSLVTSNIS